MKRFTLVATIAVASLALTACDTEHSESCEWERKKSATSTPTTPKSAMVLGKGGSSGGGGRGGSSGSRSGGGVKMNKPGGGGSASKPKFNRSNPAPKPTTNPGVGLVWVWDCD